MAEELKLINANSREDANLSPLSKIEIYSFFDPFSKECFKLSAILSKLRLENNHHPLRYTILLKLRVLVLEIKHFF